MRVRGHTETSQDCRDVKERRSPRLRGFDYSEPGEYFVTVCTAERACILGEVVDGTMVLSDNGKTVNQCWREIPDHSPHVRADVCQIMPNHLHGIIEIVPVGASRPGGTAPLHTPSDQPMPGSLGAIIRSFKSAATKSSYYDHIIRDDKEHFLIEQYITLNPLMWYLDRNNPSAQRMTVDQMRRELLRNHGLDEYTVERILEQSA